MAPWKRRRLGNAGALEDQVAATGKGLTRCKLLPSAGFVQAITDKAKGKPSLCVLYMAQVERCASWVAECPAGARRSKAHKLTA